MHKTVRTMTANGTHTPVTVTATISEGIGITIQGLPSIEVKEILLRVTTAIISIGFHIPGKKIIIDIKREDGLPVTGNAASLDLAVATSILAAAEIFPIAQKVLDRYVIVGELGLDGKVRMINCAYSIAVNNDNTILPFDNVKSCLKQRSEWNTHKVYAAAWLQDVPRILHDPELFFINNIPFRDL